MRWKRASSVAAALLLSACAALAQGSLIGKPAPAFTRTGFDGKPVALAPYRDRVVLLNFWATWCAPCQAELPRFAAWQKQYGAQGLQVVAVSMDDSDTAPRALMRRLKPGFPVVMGDEELGALYGGVLGLPVSFLIARDGTIVERIEGETDLAVLESRIVKLLAQP
jgi:cytochrome c biogenesis protein CcmG, thiol:disulfide interchange protein DsbE